MTDIDPRRGDLAGELAHHVAHTRYADLPGNVVEITKKFILDTLGTGLAGSSAPGCEVVARLISEEGGRPQSTLWVRGNRLPAANAALVNSMFAHAIEFDDTHDATTVHANASVVPAAFATAERCGPVSGQRVIEAVAVGVDLMCRLGLGLAESTPWTPAAVFGYFGAAAASAKIRQFDARQTHDALGICYSQAAGNRQCNIDRAMVKRMQLGFAARAGVQSCDFVDIGITGARNIFEGTVGMANLYFGGKFDRDRVLEALGERWLGAELSIKPYPSARPTHGGIDAALAIVNAHDLGPDDIDQVTVHVTFLVMRTCGAPFDGNRISQVEAQFSTPYTIAVAIARRGLFLDDFVEANIRSDARVLALAQRVRVVQDQTPVGPGLTPVVVEIRTRDGRTLTERTDVIKGNPDRPLDFAWVEDKFRRCARFAAPQPASAQLDAIVAMVRNLEALEDVSALSRAMSGPPANA